MLRVLDVGEKSRNESSLAIHLHVVSLYLSKLSRPRCGYTTYALLRLARLRLTASIRGVIALKRFFERAESSKRSSFSSTRLAQEEISFVYPNRETLKSNCIRIETQAARLQRQDEKEQGNSKRAS